MDTSELFAPKRSLFVLDAPGGDDPTHEVSRRGLERHSVFENMSARALVFVGFNSHIWSDLQATVIVPVINALRARGFAVAIPKGVTCKHCVEIDLLGATNVTMCLFLARSSGAQDTVLQSQLQQARSLGVKAHGFIFKGTERNHPVPACVIDMFKDNRIEFCNAIHTTAELIRCLELVPGL